MEFIETHAHLCDEKFDTDRTETIKKIYSSGISRIIEVSCTQAEWPAALSLARNYPEKMFCAFGIHPEYSETITAEQKEELKKYLALPETVALGEVGTDYWWETCYRSSLPYVRSLTGQPYSIPGMAESRSRMPIRICWT